MKTFFKISLIIIAFIIVILAAAPLLFKKQILNVAKEQANANLNAKVDFTDINLSFFKRFPNLYVGLKGVSVVGIDKFEGDTLVSFDKFEVSVDVISVIKMDSIRIKAIDLVKPVMNAIILEDGTANWDIAKASEEEEEIEDTTETTGATPQVKLRKFEIIEGRISYTDKSSNMSATLNNFNFTLHGDLSEKLTTLILNLNIGKINFIMDGMKYLKDTKLNFLADIEADLENGKYTINKNELSLNELTLGLEGVVEMKEEDILTDLKYYTTNTSFKTLLSLVPVVYMKDFEDVQTSGELKLDGTVKGKYNDNVMPIVTLDLKVANAMFKYPDLPKQVDNINIGINVVYNGVFEDSTKVDINKFHLEIAGNPVDLSMKIRTPMSDMHVDGNLKMNMQLASLADAIPMEETSISGSVSSNIDIMGNMSSIENEKYEEFKADGTLQLKDINLKSAEIGYDIVINELTMIFSPKFVELKTFDSKIGNSDIQLYGKLENFIPYVFEDKTIKGQLKFTSSYLDLNQFMTEDTTIAEQAEVEDTAAMAVVEVPKNIDFTLQTNLEKVIYDKMTIDDITGIIKVKDGAVQLQNLNMNTLGGFINISGEYNTADLANPFTDLDLVITDVDITQTVTAFNTIEKLAPVAKQASGKISAKFSFSTFLQNDMTPRMNSVVSSGMLNSKSIKVENPKMFSAIGDKLGTDKFKTLNINDLDLNFSIRDGKLTVEPFEAKLGKGKAMIGGEQFLDQTINYAIGLTMPRSELGGDANNAIGNLTSNAMAKGISIEPGENMNFDIKVGGTVTDPKVMLDLKSNAKETVQAVKEKVIEKSKEEVKKVVDDSKQKANAEAQRIINNAEKQSAQVMEQARMASDKTKKEYYAKADKIEKEASGQPKFARDAAKKSADKVRKEGDDKSAQILKEGETKSKGIMDKARQDADKLTK